MLDGLDLGDDLVAVSPRVVDAGGGFDRSHLALPALDASAERFDFVGVGPAAGGQVVVGPGVTGQRLDLVPQPLPFADQRRQPPGGLRFIVRFGVVAADQLAALPTQTAEHVDQRHAVQTAGEFVQFVGRGGVVEGAQFLQFADADGEHVVEDRFVDAAQQRHQPVRAVGVAVVAGDADPPAFAVAVGHRRGAVDFVTAAGAGDADRPARRAAVHRRQISLAAVRGDAVGDRPQELHQRRLAGFVGPVEDGHRFRQRVDRQSRPDAESVDVDVANLHAFDPVRVTLV